MPAASQPSAAPTRSTNGGSISEGGGEFDDQQSEDPPKQATRADLDDASGWRSPDPIEVQSPGAMIAM